MRDVRTQSVVDLVSRFGKVERLTTELREKALVLTPRGEEDDDRRRDRVVRDPPRVRGVSPDRERLLFQQRGGLERDAVEANRIDPALARHDPDPLGVALRSLHLSSDLGEGLHLEDAGRVTGAHGRGRRSLGHRPGMNPG